MSGLPLLVLHEPGDEAAGRPWREALDDMAWTGPALAPDLPGHGQEPAPVGGSYDLTDAAVFAVQLLAGGGPELERPVIVGVVGSGWAAQTLALGGRARALVLVDGLGGPWRTPAETIAAAVAWARAVADDPAAVGAPPTSGLDPRLRHGMATMASRPMAERAAAALDVPVLVLTTPESPLPAAACDDLVASFAEATVVPVADRSPGAVLPAVAAWLGA